LNAGRRFADACGSRMFGAVDEYRQDAFRPGNGLPAVDDVPSNCGPLRRGSASPDISAYRFRLVRRGYADHTARIYLYGVAHFARWMRLRHIAASSITEGVVHQFIAQHLLRYTCPTPVRRCVHEVRAALRHLLATLVPGRPTSTHLPLPKLLDTLAFLSLGCRRRSKFDPPLVLIETESLVLVVGGPEGEIN
jgi:hypothetical protein